MRLTKEYLINPTSLIGSGFTSVPYFDIFCLISAAIINSDLGWVTVYNANKTVGENIAKLRARRQMTREALALKIGRDVSWVRRIENGQTLPPEMLSKMAEVFNLSDPLILIQHDAFDD